MNTTAFRQRGISFFGLILTATVLIIVAIFGLRVIPSYMHSAQIGHIFKAVAADPAMQNATVREIKDSYTKRANIDYVSDITAEDIEISRDGGTLSLSASYSVKVPLAGNVTLLLEFNPRSF
jgi:Tfp pilus assembly protein PilE